LDEEQLWFGNKKQVPEESKNWDDDFSDSEDS